MKKILVADDSVTIQKVIALTFAEEAFEIQSVGTGSEALEKIQEWRPDIVLADVIMPQMNGYELSKAIKEDQATGGIPVLLLAGTFEAFDEEEAKSAGADGYITKPFESEELIGKVKSLLGVVDAPSVQVPPPAPAQAPRQVVQEPPQPQPQVQASHSEEPMSISGDLANGLDDSVNFEPSPGGAAPQNEPDIWDILGEVASSPESESAGGAVPEAETSVPSFGPLEDAGVVDVGSFEVGLDKGAGASPEVPIAGGQTQDPKEVEFSPVPEAAAPDKSPVEGRERDFFGLDENQAPSMGSLDDAIEEISFEVQDDADVIQAGDAPSMAVPGPLESEQDFAGDTLSPETLMSDMPEDSRDSSKPESGAGLVPTAEEIAPSLSVQDLPPASPPQEPVPTTVENQIQSSAQPDAAPAAPMESTPVEAAPVPQAPAGMEVSEPSPSVKIDLDDAAIREIIRKAAEEKAEKVAWEVIPELAEVLIREAISKIKSET